jgi:hypothetical protein
MKLETEVGINAPPRTVWEVLTDFGAYASWNPFIERITGELAEGGDIEVRFADPSRKVRAFRPRLIRVEPGRELRWLGRLILPRIFDGEHYFTLEELDGGGTRLVQGETFRGLLVPFSRGFLATETRGGFERMNRALRARAEKRFADRS